VLKVVPAVGANVELLPLTKWVGGKRRLAPALLAFMPRRWSGDYWEPFVGGGAIFCALYNAGRLKGRRVVLADRNKALIDLYRFVQATPKKLIDSLTYMRDRYEDVGGEAFYREQRDLWNAGHHMPARLVFLLQTCFNGLWRENAKGLMNTPWGKHKRPSLFDVANVMAWHKALQGVELRDGDYATTCKPKSGDLVYLDPPYADTFTNYAAGGFGPKHQVALLQKAQGWRVFGTKVYASNSLAIEPLLDKHAPTATRHRVTTNYLVNRDGQGRTDTQELLVIW